VIQSVERAATVLQVLAVGPPGQSLGEVAARTGLAKPTAHGLLRTLESRHLVRRDPGGRYSLGSGVLTLGTAYLAGSRLRALSVLPAARLAQEVDEKVWVGELADDRVLVVHHEFRPHDSTGFLDVGAALPWYACALGHAVVAHAEAAELEELLARERPALTGRTRTGRAPLRRALAAVRRQGYAVEESEASVGDAGIAAPVFDAGTRPVGSLGLSGPAERLLAPSAQPRLCNAVVRAAAAVSRELGGRRPGPA